jgi:hypothetical protein
MRWTRCEQTGEDKKVAPEHGGNSRDTAGEQRGHHTGKGSRNGPEQHDLTQKQQPNEFSLLPRPPGPEGKAQEPGSPIGTNASSDKEGQKTSRPFADATGRKDGNKKTLMGVGVPSIE